MIEDEGEGKIAITTTIPTQVIQGGQIATGTSTPAQVQTTVKPKIIGERNNLIRMGVGINVSSPSGKGTVSRTISTIIHVRDGSSAVIGGLISSFLSKGYNQKDPEGTTANPIVNLYSAKSYDTKKSQFVVFITPLIKSQSHIGVERIKRKFKLDE